MNESPSAQCIVVHLSDIHIKGKTDPVLSRIDVICSAVATHKAMSADRCVVVVCVSGDLAFSGTKVEYDYVGDFLQGISERLGKTFMDVRFFIVPGNHDCDFSETNMARDVILKSVEPSKVDKNVISILSSVQKEFFAFVERLSSPSFCSGLTESNPMFAVSDVQLSNATIRFCGVNSSWMSLKHDVQGGRFFPLELLSFPDQRADFVVTTGHHPDNWYESNEARKMREKLEDQSDLILLGHEHGNEYFTKMSPERLEDRYLEGGVLQDSGAAANSSFNVICIDPAHASIHTTRYKLDGDIYKPFGHPASWESYRRGKERTKDRLKIAGEIDEFLSDPGAQYTHIKRERIYLEDLFVYPDIEEVSLQKVGEALERKCVKSRDVRDFILSSKNLFIYGQEQSGKTSLAKMTFRALQHAGIFPIYFDFLEISKVRRPEDISGVIEAQIEKHYPGEKLRYQQLPQEKKAILIDGFYSYHLTQAVRRLLFAEAQKQFGHVAAFSDQLFQVEELVTYGSADDSFGAIKFCEILEFGNLLRHSLIEKWLALDDEFVESAEERDFRLTQYDARVSIVIGNKLVPSLPIFILMILQQIDANTIQTAEGGSYGYFYQVFITQALSSNLLRTVEIDTKLNYLSELGWYLFSRRVGSVGKDELREFHKSYNARYAVELDFERLLENLIRCGQIEYSYDSIKFKYKYIFCFFVARKCAFDDKDASVISTVRGVCETPHLELHAHIILFLNYFSKNEFVIDALVGLANKLLAEDQPYTFAESPACLKRLGGSDPQGIFVLNDESRPKENRERMLTQMDDADSHQPARKKSASHIDYFQEGDIEEQYSQIYQASKIVQLLGQILKNHAGSILGDRKIQVLNACTDLGLRHLSAVFKIIDLTIDGVVDAVTNFVLKDKDGATREGMAKKIREFCVIVIQLVAVEHLKVIGRSIGSQKLFEAYRLAKLERNNSIGHSLIDFNIRLEESRPFPLVELKAVLKDVDKKHFAKTILRLMVFRHLYLTEIEDFRIKQIICELLEIPLQRAVVVQQKARAKQLVN